jgi:hypothetical protein
MPPINKHVYIALTNRLNITATYTPPHRAHKIVDERICSFSSPFINGLINEYIHTKKLGEKPQSSEVFNLLTSLVEKWLTMLLGFPVLSSSNRLRLYILSSVRKICTTTFYITLLLIQIPKYTKCLITTHSKIQALK